jgi:hypothetical protein
MKEITENSHYQTSLLIIQETAKQVCTIVPIIQTAYFAAISMSDLKQIIWQDWSRLWWLGILFVCPAILWLLSLFVAIAVFVPIKASYGGGISATYDFIIRRRYLYLAISLWLSAAGLLFMAINMAVYFICLPPPPPPQP